MLVIYCIALLLFVSFIWAHLTNPFVKGTIFKGPYRTFVDEDGNIGYVQNYQLRVFTGPLANTLGYYKGGVLIVQNTFFKGAHARGTTVEAIIRDIHEQRFDPSKPYLISGDQFSVLYPRNLGVFYNQLLNPNTALNSQDWEHRQRIYLQSVLFAIDGLSASINPRTTVIPIGPRHAVLTQVHPGGIGSDQVFGLFYALDVLRDDAHQNGSYRHATKAAAKRILSEKKQALQFIYDSYIAAVHQTETLLVRENLHLSSARDGVIRSSSFYDNIILYETIRLAEKLGLKGTLHLNIKAIEQKIKDTYWNESRGYYNDDAENHHFSSDWLIGYVTGFFDLQDARDLQRTLRTISYIETTNLANPFPIKYQLGGNLNVPRFVKIFVPSYGTDAIWSYWGTQYISLLADVFKATRKTEYLNKAQTYIAAYEQNIIKNAGFPETYNAQGEFFRSTLYKSIRVTGWVVEFEYAKDLVRRYGKLRRSS